MIAAGLSVSLWHAAHPEHPDRNLRGRIALLCLWRDEEKTQSMPVEKGIRYRDSRGNFIGVLKLCRRGKDSSWAKPTGKDSRKFEGRRLKVLASSIAGSLWRTESVSQSRGKSAEDMQRTDVEVESKSGKYGCVRHQRQRHPGTATTPVCFLTFSRSASVLPSHHVVRKTRLNSGLHQYRSRRTILATCVSSLSRFRVTNRPLAPSTRIHAENARRRT
ncbi:hypothetical protein C8R47DRAFT_514198 [Mycena vitilis]|nr:hypothetical protein C8R47DRAFT_514198 [Mycena vitilis]